MIKSLNKYCNSFPSTYDSVRVGCPTLLKCKKTDNNCTTLFTDLFFIPTRQTSYIGFTSTFHYIDVVLSLIILNLVILLMHISH